MAMLPPPTSPLTIHFIQDEFIRGDIQLPKLQGLLESRSTPLKRGRLVNVGYRKAGNKIQWDIPNPESEVGALSQGSHS